MYVNAVQRVRGDGRTPSTLKYVKYGKRISGNRTVDFCFVTINDVKSKGRLVKSTFDYQSLMFRWSQTTGESKLQNIINDKLTLKMK